MTFQARSHFTTTLAILAGVPTQKPSDLGQGETYDDLASNSCERCLYSRSLAMVPLFLYACSLFFSIYPELFQKLFNHPCSPADLSAGAVYTKLCIGVLLAGT